MRIKPNHAGRQADPMPGHPPHESPATDETRTRPSAKMTDNTQAVMKTLAVPPSIPDHHGHHRPVAAETHRASRTIGATIGPLP